MSIDYQSVLNPSAAANGSNAGNDYADLFDQVQKRIVQNHMNDLNNCLTQNSFDTEEILKRHISFYLEGLGTKEQQTVDSIFADMTSFGFLNKYFADRENIEEININSIPDGTPEHPGCVIVNYSDGRKVHVHERFASIQQGVNVLKRMLQKSDELIDELNAMKVTYVGKNVRMAIAVEPICEPESGAVASIRFTQPNKFTPKETMENGTLSLPMFTGLSTFLNNEISIVVCGDTGSGKTTFMSTLLTTIPDQKRTGVVQDGTNDFALTRRDSQGHIVNDIFQLFTRQHPVPDYNISLERLLDFMMRMDPTIVVVGEMVSEEAFIAQEMARTGHGVIVSIHSNSAEDAYQDRMYTLALRKYQIPKSEMLGMIVRGFPIAVFMHKYKDGKRRVSQIVEAVDVVDGRVVFNPLYQYHVKDNVKDEQDRVLKVVGEFEKLNDISDTLKQRLINAGMSQKEVTDVFGGELLDRYQRIYLS